ncbi:girdin [Cimex lectularius]|uniref:Calponin-homology (CH) domain-containing protein n=1 Tax=Cimex lectularius TaxID=79782 RepID=A0A8I6RXP1_CIMLE|nr:girdin [Cimex lectularius]
MTTKTDIEEFLESPLVTWFKSCLNNPDRLSDYEDLADGNLIYEVFLLIDPEPLHHGITTSLGNATIRTKNFECITKNIKTLYEEELGQLVVVLPDPIKIGREPDSKEGIEQLQLLLMLLLGCAVQCPNKQLFIERIKELPVDAQHSLVDCIKRVTESQEIVLVPELSENVPVTLFLGHIRRLIKQRDFYFQVSYEEKSKQSTGNLSSVPGSESQHLAVELADWKSKLRKLRQDVEEKSEALSEAKDELEYNKALVTKLKTEVNELKTEARVGKAYRDEADALREKAERAERLETEVCKYREKLSDLEYYKSRVEELRQDKRILEETREMLEEQLARARSRVDYTLELETKLLDHKQTINDLSLERDATQERLQQLFEENAQLTLLSKSALNSDKTLLDPEETSVSGGENSLCEQLSNNAQGRALKLELENKRLAQTLESLQEATLHQTNERLLQLEKDKKKLSLQVEELEEAKKKLTSHISELEATVKNAQKDTKKMQDLRDSLQTQLQLKIEEVETVQREKGRMELRIKEAEETIEALKAREILVDETLELKAKLSNSDREVSRLKNALEGKAVNIDRLQCELDNSLKEKSQISRQLEEANNQVFRLVEIEKSWKDLNSRYEVDKATIETLQSDLVAEKMINRKLRDSLESPGFASEELNEGFIEKIFSNADILGAVKEKLAENEGESKLNQSKELQEENARLSVSLSTLQSQVQSLTAQHTAQKLANSQLVAEKEEINKHLESLREQHQQLLLDQLTMQGLHETLTTQYEQLSVGREATKAEIKLAKTEIRSLKEINEGLEARVHLLTQEIKRLSSDENCLSNLRAEHSKLKEDFRKLFTSHDKLKSEYKTAQEEYKNMKVEVRNLTVSQTELHAELTTRIETNLHLEDQLADYKTENECLKQVKSTLEEERKSLMKHVTILLDQYRELLHHSLDDKDHFHAEEKLLRDQFNSICRQKEKLEEKIMEQIINSRSSNKKKSFGANLVRRVRKAGSELINKSRRSWHEDPMKTNLQGTGGGGGGTDSDTSLEDVRSRQDSLSGLGSAGTRRTVYLSGDENSASTNDHDDKSYSNINDVPRSSTPQQDPSVLVYNRVTVRNSDNQSIHSNSSPAKSQHQSLKHNEVWCEYGSI